MSGEKKEKIGRIKEAWKEALDKKALAHTQPAAYKAKRLVVNIDASAWMYELNLQKQEIKKKLNEKLGKDGININEIIFRIGEI
jgi:predicted nucleic acid-binding Zn ribbon protein